MSGLLSDPNFHSNDTVHNSTRIVRNVVDSYGFTAGPDEEFGLNDSFLNGFKGRDPEFGYNGLGEVTYYRTYSRLKENGGKERFWETINRVVDGTFEIQRRHCHRFNLPWDRMRAQDSAQEMFQRIWDFKFVPPGRGLWVMGTPFMWRAGGAGLNNCFAHETEFITREGIKKLGDCVNTTQKILTSGGKWVDAKIKSFGEQQLTKVVLRRGRWRKVIHATPDHRWFVHSKSRKFATVGAADDSNNTCTRECTTEELKDGLRLSMNFGQGINNSNLRPSAFGIAHGVCFGDGTTGSDNESHGTYLYLCKPKDAQLERFFLASHRTEAPERGEHGAIRVADLPRAYRRAPDLNESLTYLYGFLCGYFAADGDVTDKGTVRIASSERQNLELVQSVCAILGIGTFEISQGLQTIKKDGQVKKFIGYRLTLMAEHLNPEFFLIDDHRERFEIRISASRKKISTYQSWYVDSVESTCRTEEVFCPQVPETYCFTLAGNILTGNCGFVSTNQDFHEDPAQPFAFAMDMLMLGVGIGFDTKGADVVMVRKPVDRRTKYIIDDSREGWVLAFIDLVHSYTLHPEYGRFTYDFSEIRPNGTPIKGFGGEASGPGELEKLLFRVDDFFGKMVGRRMNSVDITDLMNMVGKCVVAGNVRRSAEIAFGFPGDIEYRSMKNPVRDLSGEETEKFYKVTGDLYGKNRYSATVEDFTGCDIQSDKLDRAIDVWNACNDRRWASNNSVFSEIGMDYTDVGQQTAANGEPGYIWLDNMRDYGRMKDGFQPGIDGRVMGSNPCFAGSGNLFTDSGYKNIENLWKEQGALLFDGFDADMLDKYGSQSIINNNGISKATKIYKTGDNQEVFRVKFNDGSWIDATETHEFIVLNRTVRRIGGGKKKTFFDEQRCKLANLQIGQLIPLNQQVHFGTFHDPVYSELSGWCIGDGSLSPRSSGQTRAECTVYDEDSVDVLPRLRGLMLQLFETHSKSKNVQPEYAGWERDFSGSSFDHQETRIGSNVLGRLLAEDGVICGNKHQVPFSVLNGTKATLCAFLRGLASADGYVNLTKNSISIRIWQVNDSLLRECRLLLNQLGIASTVQFRHNERKLKMNDGKGGLKEYNCKPGWELIVSGIKQTSKFLDDIGFIQDWKSAKAVQWLQSHRGSNNSNTGRYVNIESIESIGWQPVYCLTEPETNQVVVNGYQVGQCVEQTLESYELCNLVETFPSKHDNEDDYMRTIKYAYLYGKTVTLLPTHNNRTNRVMLRNRRIGLSQSGIVQAMEKFGRRRYLQNFCDAAYSEIRRWDNIYSEWLTCRESVKVTSVKPSGTVSLLAGVAPGVHFPEARSYWRRMRINKNHSLVGILAEAGYHIEPSVTDPDNTIVVKFGVEDEGVRPVADVSIWEQMDNVASMQYYWADNAVSVTIKFDPDEAKDIPTILSHYEDRIKAVSFLPKTNHGYVQAPYEAADREEVRDYLAGLKEIDMSQLVEEAVGEKYCDSDKCVLN